MATQRAFDIVLYGATGFVGRQAVAYFAEHAAGLRWALAGRSAAKLEAVRAECGPGAAGAGILVADAQDAAALDKLATQTRVVLSTAGPFALYGSGLVAACVANRTHYVDITGETPWVRGLIDRHHEQAARDGTRIIPCCGFDSVPSDLGTLLVVEAMLAQHGEPCASVKACHSIRGGLNGGTLASAMNMLETGQDKLLADPFLLNPAGTAPARRHAHADPVVPHRDPDFGGAWVGPFVMGKVNTRVVRRSAALLGAAGAPGYREGFVYQEYLRFGKGPLAAAAAGGITTALAMGMLAMRLPPARSVGRMLAPSPGEGPSDWTMDAGSFRCELVGISASGKRVQGRVAGSGDPGNRATTRFVCESALALAAQPGDLPGGPARGGLLTPASGLGMVLARRLAATGKMTLEPLPA
jgi:short subunit dehydrogenase-like uncharacterized protein